MTLKGIQKAISLLLQLVFQFITQRLGLVMFQQCGEIGLGDGAFGAQAHKG